MTGENLLTEEELAQRLRVSPRRAGDLRREHDWPHVKLGRRVRYTEHQAKQIVALQTAKPAPKKPTALPGQTARSARRSA